MQSRHELAVSKTLATLAAPRPALKHASFSVCVTARSRSQRAASRQSAAARSGRSRPLESQGGVSSRAQPSPIAQPPPRKLRARRQGTMGKKDEEPPPIDAATRRTVANIQADWDNRELVEIVQLNLLTITKFLNDFDSATRYKLARVNEKLTRLERTLDSCEAAVRATLEGEGAASSSPPPRRPLPSSSPAKKKPPPPPSPPKKKPPPPPPKK